MKGWRGGHRTRDVDLTCYEFDHRRGRLVRTSRKKQMLSREAMCLSQRMLHAGTLIHVLFSGLVLVLDLCLQCQDIARPVLTGQTGIGWGCPSTRSS